MNTAALRAIRTTAGLSFGDLSRLIAAEQHITVHPDSLNKIENGTRGSSRQTLNAIAKALRCDPIALIGAPVPSGATVQPKELA